MSNIYFTEQGTPFSTEFNDIYFDNDHGCQQSEAIFISANQLADRFYELVMQHALGNKPALFTIAETGFGTGLNFLLALRCFQQAVDKVTAECLQYATSTVKTDTLIWQFISVEKYPLSLSELRQALKLFPELNTFSAQLLAQYPELINNQLSLKFAQGKIRLNVIIDDAVMALHQLSAPKKGLVDVWFLDGFCPSKNPAMWQPTLFEQLARLAKPNASLATFTVAGAVRRGLTAVGFRTAKQVIDGSKSHILIARYQQNVTTLGYQLRPIISKPQHVSIIGGGIAAACAAYSLTKQGIKVTVYCKDAKLGQGASSNAVGALYPLIRQRSDVHSYFYQKAFWHAKKYYQQLAEQDFKFDHQWCGLIDLAYNASLLARQQKFTDEPAWSPSLIHAIDANSASKIAGMSLTMGGLFMPQAGWLAPQQLVHQLFAAAQITQRLKIETNVHVKSITMHADQRWLLNIANSNKKISCPLLIICSGAESINLEPVNQLPISPLRGQITQLNTTDKMRSLTTILCHKGYITPAHQGNHCIGATFTKNSLDYTCSSSDDQQNLNTLAACLPGLADWTTNDIIANNARSRCMTPDHLPIVGGMPNIEQHLLDYPHLAKDKNWRYKTPAKYLPNLYLLTGLGARGLCSAPLLADILTAELCGSPYPVNDNLLFNLSANRFVIKSLIKQRNNSDQL